MAASVQPVVSSCPRVMRWCCRRATASRCSGSRVVVVITTPRRLRPRVRPRDWPADSASEPLRNHCHAGRMKPRRIAVLALTGVALAAAGGGAVAATQDDPEQSILEDAAKRLNVTPKALRDAL